VRNPTDIPRPTTRPEVRRRRRLIIIVGILVILVLAFLHSFAIFYTDALWFSSVGLHAEWWTLFKVKVGLVLTFAVTFAVLLTISFMVAERLAPRGPALDAEDEFVKRYREVAAPYGRRIRAVVTAVLAFIVGVQAVGQWQDWLLYRNGASFVASDPQFHRNVGYFVFVLPFQEFLVHWFLVALVVILLATVVSHYLNGGIRIQGQRPRVRPAVKAHISVILGLLALVKAVGYYLARYGLDLSGHSLFDGANYTDIHARIPALELLILVSLAAAVLLMYNLRRQGWALPALGVGLWFLVALTAGTIYPAAIQALKVNPDQNQLERPYLQRNIDATRSSMAIDRVGSKPYPASANLTAGQLSANSETLSNVRLWDPTQTQPTYDKLQDIRSYYQFDSLALDRYKVNKVETPAVVGVREINDQGLPASSWVNTTLQYTHGYGMVISPANVATSNGDPQFAVGNVPPNSSEGLPLINQPSVYFGLDNSTYVVADTKQPEIDYQLTNNQNVETHYQGTGGVQLSSVFRRAMFALRFSDYNLLISNLITDRSRIMFDRGLQARVAKAAPFLSLDADPYPVLVNGQIEWVQDAYTTTSNYPYAQQADTSALNANSGLNKNFNYVRNSVKVVENAYTGKMTFYVIDPKDPIIQAYEKAFPGMFTPISAMPSTLSQHLRYPEDIFTVQATAFGRYHVKNAASFYSGADAWALSPTPGAGSPSQAPATQVATNAQGEQVSTGQLVRMAPLYQEFQQPGHLNQSFSLLDAFVPVSSQSQIQTLSGFMIAGCDPGDYGRLTTYVTPRSQPVNGPSIVAAKIDATPAVSQQVSLLNQNGSSVLLGNVEMIPVAGALLYVEPLYVESSRNAFPELQRVIAVYGNQPAAIGDTLAQALTSLFSAPVSTQGGSPGSNTLSPEIRALLAQAQAAYVQSQADLKAGNLGAYQADITLLESYLQQIQEITGVSATTTTTSPSTSTTSTTSTTSSTSRS